MSEQERDEKLGGEIALGLVLLGGICAFPLALLADRFSRKLLLVVICVEINRCTEATDAPVARHSWLAKQSSADLENEFRDAAADETTSLLHRPPSRFRDAAQ